jgi:hypothetical protein
MCAAVQGAIASECVGAGPIGSIPGRMDIDCLLTLNFISYYCQ